MPLELTVSLQLFLFVSHRRDGNFVATCSHGMNSAGRILAVAATRHTVQVNQL